MKVCKRTTPVAIVIVLVSIVIGVPGISAQGLPLSASVPPDPLPVRRIAFGSCIQQDRPMPILNTIVAGEPDLFIFLGDNIYGDTEDMDVLRAKYNRLAADPGFQSLKQQCPVLATWDDHDYGVNDGGADYPMRQESQQVFLNFWDDPAESPRRSRPGVYDSYLFGPDGQRLQVILLDTRYFRSPLRHGERRVGGPHQPDTDPTKTMLGDAQWSWLKQQLLVPANLRIIATSIQCIAADAGQETWSNLPLQRQRLFDLIRETHANGVLLISGDRHWSEFSMLNESVAYPLYELTSSSLNQEHPRGTPTENRYRVLPDTFHRENFGEIVIRWDLPDPEIVLQIRSINADVELAHQIRLSELQVR